MLHLNLRLKAFRTSQGLKVLTALMLCSAMACSGHAQANGEPGPKPEVATPALGNPDAQVVGGMPIAPQTPAQLERSAWSMLSDSVSDAKHPDLRIQALAALGLLGGNERSLHLITSAMGDHDVDVRTAAVLAGGQAKSRRVTNDLRRMLDDSEPAVAFAAALALSKMGDRSGEDILMAVVDGERRTSAGLVDGTLHTMNKDLHSPGTLARMGAMQGAGMLLGPFGIGITAYEYLRRNGGDSARVTAIEALTAEKTEPIYKELTAALADRDPGVRAAAAKALGEYRNPSAGLALTALFNDTKAPVRLTAAASYLLATGTVVKSEPRKARHL